MVIVQLWNGSVLEAALDGRGCSRLRRISEPLSVSPTSHPKTGQTGDRYDPPLVLRTIEWVSYRFFTHLLSSAHIPGRLDAMEYNYRRRWLSQTRLVEWSELQIKRSQWTVGHCFCLSCLTFECGLINALYFIEPLRFHGCQNSVI